MLRFLHVPVPVIGVIDGPYWQEAYASLIQLRQEEALLREGEGEWYAASDENGVFAYRLTNNRHQHNLVAVNLSDHHQKLPLPFGFMADSKVKLWASYEPTIREVVTSKPILLPARSAVVIIFE